MVLQVGLPFPQRGVDRQAKQVTKHRDLPWLASLHPIVDEFRRVGLLKKPRGREFDRVLPKVDRGLVFTRSHIGGSPSAGTRGREVESGVLWRGTTPSIRQCDFRDDVPDLGKMPMEVRIG